MSLTTKNILLIVRFGGNLNYSLYKIKNLFLKNFELKFYLTLSYTHFFHLSRKIVRQKSTTEKSEKRDRVPIYVIVPKLLCTNDYRTQKRKNVNWDPVLFYANIILHIIKETIIPVTSAARDAITTPLVFFILTLLV